MKQDLLDRAAEIRDETLPLENSAYRIGSFLGDVVEFAESSGGVSALNSQKGMPLGIASLDGVGRVPIAQLPVGATATTVAAGNHTHDNLVGVDVEITDEVLDSMTNKAGKLRSGTTVPPGCSNSPVIGCGAVGYALQMTVSHADNALYFRSRNAFVWNPWHKVWTHEALPVTVASGVLYVKDIVATG